MEHLFGNEWVKVVTIPATTASGIQYPHHVVTLGEAGVGSVVAAISMENDTPYVCFVQQYRPALGKTMLELPRGETVDGSFEEAARELEEETTYVASKTRAKPLGVFHSDSGMIHSTIYAWLFELDAGLPGLANDYVEEESGCTTHWIPLKDVHKMVVSGQITDGMTLSTLTKLFATVQQQQTDYRHQTIHPVSPASKETVPGELLTTPQKNRYTYNQPPTYNIYEETSDDNYDDDDDLRLF